MLNRSYLAEHRSLRSVIKRTVIPPVALLSALVCLFLWQFARLSAASRLALHVDDVIDQARQLQAELLDMETGMRGYLIGGRAEYLDPFLTARPRITPTFQALESITLDRRVLAQVKGLKVKIDTWTHYADAKIKGFRLPTSAASRSAENDASGKRMMEGIRREISQIIVDERALLVSRTDDFESFQAIISWVMAAVSVLFALLLILITRRHLRSLSGAYEKVIDAESVRTREVDLARAEADRASEAVVEILDGMNEGFIETDSEWRILRVNRVQEKISQVGRKKVLGRNFWETFPSLSDPSCNAWIENHRVMVDRIPVEYEDYYEPMDIWVHRRVSPREGGGIAIFFRDVTELRKKREALERSEYRANRLMRFNILGVIFADIHGNITGANDAFCNLLGYECDELLLHAGALEGLTPPEYLFQNDLIIAELRTHGASSVFEKEYIKKDGTRIDVLMAGATVDEKTGESAFFIVDVTRRKQAEFALASQIQILESERALREIFVSTLTHDLRTPLTAIQACAQLLLRHPDAKPEVREKLAVRILNGAIRANRMIQDLLDTNRIKAGETLPQKIESNDLSDVARDTLDELTLTHGQRFVLDGQSGDFRGFWCGDGLRRILENLCSNAVKYGAPDTPITVTLSRQPESVEFSVHNQGVVLTEQEQVRLFEPFQRSQTAQSGGQMGWGLGLTLVQGIAEAHGGKVRVLSSLEGGTEFTVALPLDSRSS